MARRSPALGPPSGVGSAERRRRSPPTSSRSCSIASPECGFVFQPALPVEALRSNHDEEYFEHYSAEGDYDAQGPQRRREARARLRWMREHGCDGGRLLEVGVARGDFPRRGPERGLRAAASRPSRNVCGSKKPTEVMVGWAEEVALPPASFDAVGIEPEPGCAAVARRRSGAGYCVRGRYGRSPSRCSSRRAPCAGRALVLPGPRSSRREDDPTAIPAPSRVFGSPRRSTSGAHPWKQDLLRAG